MGKLTSQLVVMRGSLGTIMIHYVRFAFHSCAFHCCSAVSRPSSAPCPVSQDGNTMCDVRRVWNLARPRKQGTAPTRSLVRIPSDHIPMLRRFLRTISSFSCPLPEEKISSTSLTSSATQMAYNSSVGSVAGRMLVIYMIKRGVGCYYCDDSC
jgi:hypothetical protein